VSLLHNVLIESMRFVPRPVIWRFSSRYIAGTSLEDAYQTVRELNDSGSTATIDVLGEDSTSRAQVEAAERIYLAGLDGINSLSLKCGVSIKLSEMGLRFDGILCKKVLRNIVSAAQGNGIFVRIDMEDSSVTTATLDLYRELRAEFDNMGTVIQSCLHRSESDIESLLREGPTNIRLCKGIYIEPEDISYRDADEIRGSYKRLLEQLFEGGATQVAIATHDPALVEHAENTIRRMNIAKDRYEFQMLLGVAGPLRRELIARGHSMRVYVPFGERWLDYSLRRLRENPDMLGHIVGNVFRSK
jgi:proline dehydrogenase